MQWFERFFVSRRMFFNLQQQVFYIMATQAEVIAKISALGDKLVKIGGETTALIARVDELQAVIEAGGDASPELVAAVEALVAQAQVVDDLVADAVPVVE